MWYLLSWCDDGLTQASIEVGQATALERLFFFVAIKMTEQKSTKNAESLVKITKL